MRVRNALIPLAMAFAVSACSDSPSGVTGPDAVRPSLGLVAPPSGPPAGEAIVVCKTGGQGSYDFTYSGTDFSPTVAPISGAFSLSPGECWNVGFFGGAGGNISVTEVPRTGHNVVSIAVDQLTGPDQFLTGTNTVSNIVASGTPRQSALVTFTNEVVSTPVETGTEGCTPGYWKNHPASWAATSYTSGQTVGSVFAIPGGISSLASKTLLQSLDGGGGPGVLGAAKILLRAGTAALLNAGNPGVDYTMTTAEVITAVNAALASNDRDTILALAASIDADNNLGCPLN